MYMRFFSAQRDFGTKRRGVRYTTDPGSIETKLHAQKNRYTFSIYQYGTCFSYITYFTSSHSKAA